MVSTRALVVCGLVGAVALVTTARVMALYRGIDDRAAYWEQPRGEEGGLLYVALGDSAAQGLGSSSPDTSYVGLIAAQLREQSGRPVQVVNLSRSGAKVRDVIETQLPRLHTLDRKPDLITVGIGGNDVRSFDEDRYADDARELVAALPAEAYVADGPNFIFPWWTAEADRAAEILAAELRRNDRRLVPLHREMRSQGRGSLFTQFAADLFHPNDRGYRTWARAFWERIRQDLR